MNVLLINCGSSSVKIEVIQAETTERLLVARLSDINQTHPEFSLDGEKTACPESGHQACLDFAIPKIKSTLGDQTLSGIVHRVVHGGAEFSGPVEIDESVETAIEKLSSLAPLHNPINLLGIKQAKKHWPELPHIAVFDTAFHNTLPKRAQSYALSSELSEKHGIRRYGFHGSSHSYVSRKAAEFLKQDIRQLRLISCHLGNGASLAAVEFGRSIETSMGMTPLEGLVMGTRSGDVDPGILIHLMKEENWDSNQLDEALNKKSGLKGISGTNDMQDIENMAAGGNEAARKAIQIFSHRLRKYIGAYAAVLGGVDAIIFTGGIGENSATIRERACQRLEFLGAILDEDANRDADLDDKDAIADISMSHSRCKLLVIPTDEQYEMVRKAKQIIQKQHTVKDTALRIPVAISARHLHLTQESIDILFGKGYQLTEYKPLSQPGQFAANERVSLVGPKNTIERVRILGPVRSKNQVEISRTDEFFLGIDAPVRASGHVENTPGIKLVGPEGSLSLKEGVICAWRHIHMTPADAETFGVEDKDIVEIRVENEDRSLTFGNVLIRVSSKYALEMHIDTDEANAAELSRGAVGELIITNHAGQVLRKKTY